MGGAARRDDCTVLLVTVTPGAQAAHDVLTFYRRHGFRDDGRKLLAADMAPR